MKKIIFTMTSLAISLPAVAMMPDDPLLTMFKLDQFELRDADDGTPFVWEGYGWVGRDLNKLWVKTEGERVHGETEEAELQLLYGHAVHPYWDLQVGWRRDIRPEPTRDWLAIGAMGLAPYWFEVDAALFLGNEGRTSARLSAEYELLFTQRLVLTPEVEVNLYGKDDPEIGVGSGLSDMELGLRLRYEIRREFAPYIGVSWIQKFGGTADIARAEGEPTSDLQWVAGVRAWF
jgi:copper resistance protein B